MTNGGRTLLSADYKAPGGKLLRVRLRETGGRIESAKISGDFFLIPEDSLAKLEKMLEDVPLREKELKLLVILSKQYSPQNLRSQLPDGDLATSRLGIPGRSVHEHERRGGDSSRGGRG